MQPRIKVKELWIAEGKESSRSRQIIKVAKEQKIPVRYKEGRELSRILPNIAHQGFVALVQKFSYTELDHMAEISLQDDNRSLLIALDHITDEGNFGSLIRTASFFGAHGLIIPKDRSVSVTAKVLKRSSGAYVFIPIAKVVNIGRSLDLLRKKGFWIIGASGESAESIYQFDWNRDLVLILGNEQQGLSRSVRKRCHQVVGIPSSGCLDSLNVAVAGGIIMSEIVRQRKL